MKISVGMMIAAAFAFTIACAPMARAAPCSDTSGGFENWKPVMASEARAAGIGKRGISALMEASYSNATIRADRNQKSFKLSLDEFWTLRGADTIISQGRKRLAKNPDFYASLEATYGVPAGVIIAIHGMETAFGGFMGETNVISAVATLAYDCRRTEFFTGHLLGALELVDRGSISGQTTGAKHGEWGHTQFLPGNALTYGVDGSGDGVVDLNDMSDALASTAHYLRKKGWKPGRGFQEGQPNFAAIKEWNAATVYQQAIALMGARIENEAP